MRLLRSAPSFVVPLLLACGTEGSEPPDQPDAGPAVDAGELTPDAGPSTACAAPGPVLQAGVAPPARGDSVMAWDPDCERMVVFFGDVAEPRMCGPAASQFAPEGYVYDPATNQWAEIEVAGGEAPLPRARADAAWDPARGRLVLFGGRYRDGASGPYDFPNGVWAFDLETRTWTELHDGSGTAPRGRMNTVVAIDPAEDVLVVHGGGQIRSDFSGYNVDDETWIFDLEENTWRSITPSPRPERRLFHTGALDERRSRLYVFGGAGEDAFTTTSFMDDVWYLDLATETWVEVTPPGGGPAGRIKGEIAYDGARDRLVLFAGHDDTQLGNENDVWTFELEAEAWMSHIVGDTYNAPAFGFCDFPADFANIDFSSPERRESHVFVIAGDFAYMYGGRTDCGLTSDTWRLHLETMAWEELVPSFTGMTCFRSGRTDCEDAAARKCG